MRTGSLDDREEMADRAGPAIEPDHDQGFAGADLIQQARQNRPAAICRWRAPRATAAQPAAQFVELRIGALFLSRDPRVADQTAWRGGFRQFVGMSSAALRDMAFLQINKVVSAAIPASALATWNAIRKVSICSLERNGWGLAVPR